MTADVTERVLTNRAVEQYNDGTVVLLCDKPLTSDTTVPKALMTFAFMQRLIKAAVDANADSAQDDAIVTAALKLMPRLLVVRNAEKDDNKSRKPVVQLLLSAKQRADSIELTQNSVNRMVETSEQQLLTSFKRKVGKAADKQRIARVWARFSERNGCSLSVLPHNFATSVLVDCVQLAGLTGAADATSSTDELREATGIPDLITGLIEPQLEVLRNLLQPLVAKLDAVCTSTGVPEPTASGSSTPDRPARADSSNSSTDAAADAAANAAGNDAAVVHSAVLSDEERTVVADVLRNATKVIKTKWLRNTGAGKSKGKSSSHDHRIKALEQVCSDDIYKTLFTDTKKKMKVSC
jgi:hypothetical protein